MPFDFNHIEGMTLDQLREAEQSLSQEIERFASMPESDLTMDAVTQMTSAVDNVLKVRDRIATLSAEQTPSMDELATQRASLMSRMQPTETFTSSTTDQGANTAQTGTQETTEGSQSDPEGEQTEDGGDERVTVAASAIVDRVGNGINRLVETIVERLPERPTPDASLADAQQHANQVPLPSGTNRPFAITASADVPGIGQGQQFNDVASLANAYHARARNLSDGKGKPNYIPIASIPLEHEFQADRTTGLPEYLEWFRTLQSPDQHDALVAGGGWCAPPENLYNFFNIAGVDGLVDLPTMNVSRGGINFPTSPSLADAFEGVAFGGTSVAFSGASVPWLWTEQDDINAATGSPGPTKPCIRVPCPDFTERTLECYGVCVTAGNLTNSAFPEATQNFLSLVMSAHSHAMNGRFLATMAGLSTSVTGGSYAVSGSPVFQQIFGGIELAASDYRTKFRMPDSAVLEVILPLWVKGAIRSDLAWRTGTSDLLAVTDAMINQFQTSRRVRVQFVQDWQVGSGANPGQAAARTAWPTSVQFMLYAAGTFVLGSGLNLDLGVVRDSTLNASNDYTAAWSEECHLIARVGHESRLYTTAISVNGITGANSGTGNNL
jgi:hypothetical protein